MRGKAVEELLACQLRGSPPVDVLPLRRDHKADVDTVDEDVVLRNLERKRFCERVAGGAVDRGREEGGIGVTRVDGTDVDDPSIAYARRGSYTPTQMESKPKPSAMSPIDSSS